MDNVLLTEISFRTTEGDLQVEPRLAWSEEEGGRGLGQGPRTAVLPPG